MKKNKPGNKQIKPLMPFFFTEAPLFEVGAEEGVSLQELLSNKGERYQVVTICPMWCNACAIFSSNVIKTWAGESANVGFTEIIVQDRNRNFANE